MSRPALDAETKRLRGMTLAQLADEAGATKAAIADSDEHLEAIKAEFVRRNVSSAEGTLFDVTLTPPGERTTLDKAMLISVFGEPFAAHFSKTSIGSGPTLRCTARKQRVKAAIAA